MVALMLIYDQELIFTPQLLQVEAERADRTWRRG